MRPSEVWAFLPLPLHQEYPGEEVERSENILSVLPVSTMQATGESTANLIGDK